MSVIKLEKYLPGGTLPYLKKWFGDFFIHIKITRARHSKLGDYLKLKDGTHRITINATLQPQLFFFVLTHELAHLIAFEKWGFRIAPHGSEWKQTFREMLLESLNVYEPDLRPVITEFSRSPKANFMASPALVRYFRLENPQENLIFIESLSAGDHFLYRGQQHQMLGRRKINYLCKNLQNGREYLFKPLALVEKTSLL